MRFEEAVVASFTAVLLLLFTQRRRGESALRWRSVAWLFCAGGYLSAAGSFLVEKLFSRYTELWPGTWDGWLLVWTMVVAVGLTEEAAKLCVLLAADLASRGRGRLVGVPGITAVGLGFATIENLLYGAAFGAQVLVPRNLFSTLGHFCCAWAMGRFLERAADQPLLRRAVLTLAGLASAALLHAAYNLAC